MGTSQRAPGMFVQSRRALGGWRGGNALPSPVTCLSATLSIHICVDTTSPGGSKWTKPAQVGAKAVQKVKRDRTLVSGEDPPALLGRSRPGVRLRQNPGSASSLEGPRAGKQECLHNRQRPLGPLMNHANKASLYWSHQRWARFSAALDG